MTALCGPNGVGKTTLARVLCGALSERAGHVLRDGRPISRRDRRRSSCFVMQDVDYQLYAGSVADELVLGRRVDDALRSRAWAALDAFGLRDLASCHPLALSGGQKQRVILAAAYCSDANLVVLAGSGAHPWSPRADLTARASGRFVTGAGRWLTPGKASSSSPMTGCS